jgi:succinyl-diaminopimelate desuccinylase
MTLIDPVALTQALVRCPSITPEDAGAQDVMRDALEALGFACRDLPFGNIKNLLARRGTDGPHICFCGHTDVVPPGDTGQWSCDPFSATIRDGKIIGRGTADMKANIAAFVAATSHFVKDNPDFKGSISFLITGDEEADAVDGTVKVLAWMKDNNQLADFYLVGEPSNPESIGDEIKIGRRGSLNGILTVQGVQGHVAYPERADNPLPKLVKLLDVLTDHIFDMGSNHFVKTNLEVTSIDVGNKTANIIPSKGEARFNVRFNDKWTAETLTQEIRKMLDGTGIEYHLDTHSNAEAFVTKVGVLTDLVSKAVSEITGKTPKLSTGGGTSDARFAAPYGPVVEFGLINKTIHKIDEHVMVDDLHTLTAIYRKILENYFG